MTRDLEACFAGRRMLVEPLGKPVYMCFGEAACPKCKEVQSWAPRSAPGFSKKKQQKNADEYNATPVLSIPDVVFGGNVPEPDAPDLASPCRFVIRGTSFGLPHATPVFLNGVKVGETEKSSIALTLETWYRDNLFMLGQPLWTSYIEAEAGAVVELEYKNFLIRRKS